MRLTCDTREVDETFANTLTSPSRIQHSSSSRHWRNRTGGRGAMSVEAWSS